MCRADVFLHAAISEGFCNAVLEAQSMELPVVTSDADGLGENVVDGSSGFVVKRRDPRALADRMELLAANGDLRREMGSAGRRRVLEQFQLADQIRAFGKFYEAVLSENRI
jgi:colanic acid/amylovoran biosynthesis glycosyltransferase